MRMRLCIALTTLLLVAAVASGDVLAQGPTLEERLRALNPAVLARDAVDDGDSERGAAIFYRPGMACAKCHVGTDDASPPLGPDLSKLGKQTLPAHLVESILTPSKVIDKGFETVTLLTDDGKTLTGLLAEDLPDAVVLRDLAQEGKRVRVLKSHIDERSNKGPSLMPQGLVNQLASRAEFLDLVCYLAEIARKGPARARALRPAGALAPPALPEYESRVDHAGFIAAFDRGSYERGQAIYVRVCANCHGTKDQPGSLPTSLRFASGQFKNGSDPFRMYQTLTRGYGMMTPQTWMVPAQKYDVIQYIREAYLKPYNPSQYATADRAYLEGLPKGDTRGPEPSEAEPWLAMDYGPSLTATYEISRDESNFAYKGIAVRLDGGAGGVARGRYFQVFDHDTLRDAAGWEGAGFIDWTGINFNGEHVVHPHVAGLVHFANPIGPGWADPETGRFDDPRPKGRDGRPYGPLPRPWAHYNGQYRHGDRVILSYSVGKAAVLESPGLERDKAGAIFTRTLNVGPSEHDLIMRVAPRDVSAAVGGGYEATLMTKESFTVLRIPATATPLKVKVLISSGSQSALLAHAKGSSPPEDLEPLTHGGPSRWPDVLKTRATLGGGDGPFAVDVLAQPDPTPWHSRMRFTGFDFLGDGRRVVVCDWDGDVWLVDGSAEPGSGLQWRRIASGLFQPLGLKVVDGKIYVGCRDQIAVLHDLNGDGEVDFYENFNNDHQVTAHFHEFAMGLQVDTAGNFYYAKAARHALKAVVPHHGTLLRVSKDGARTDILATGFRAPNGVCLNGDGTFFLTDQEGHWIPKNRINLVRPGGFYGNFWGFTDVTDPSDAAMEQPVCWITNAFDRSPAELLWVESSAWGLLKGSLLNLSYGYGKVYVVPHERVGNLTQGGMCALPIPQFPTGIIRGRFHPKNGHLYLCGMFAWAGNQEQPGGFYRVRYTGKPIDVPVGLSARKGALVLTFTDALDPTSVAERSNFIVKTWSLKRTVNYGSEHYGEKRLKVEGGSLSADGKTVTISIPQLAPTWCMEIRYSLKSARGTAVDGVIDNTIHRLKE
jgi:putative heme-binding domain-containing protein